MHYGAMLTLAAAAHPPGFAAEMGRRPSSRSLRSGLYRNRRSAAMRWRPFSGASAAADISEPSDDSDPTDFTDTIDFTDSTDFTDATEASDLSVQ